jgi:hypothetical protein
MLESYGFESKKLKNKEHERQYDARLNEIFDKYYEIYNSKKPGDTFNESRKLDGQLGIFFKDLLKKYPENFSKGRINKNITFSGKTRIVGYSIQDDIKLTDSFKKIAKENKNMNVIKTQILKIHITYADIVDKQFPAGKWI